MMSCNEPLVAKPILYTYTPITVILIGGIHERRRACYQGALVRSIHIINIYIQRCWHLRAAYRTADHQHGIADLHLDMNATSFALGTERFGRPKYLLHKRNKTCCVLHHDVWRDGVEAWARTVHRLAPIDVITNPAMNTVEQKFCGVKVQGES